MEKSIHLSMLLEIYKNMLTPKQADVIDLYYNNNLSLAEIATELHITRQGVRKNLIDAENKLFDIEQKLGILKEKMEREEVISELITTIKDENIKQELEKLL